MAVDSSLARLKKVSSLRPCPAEQRLEGLVDFAVGLLGYFNVPCAVDFAVVGGMAFSRCRRQATAAKKAVGKFVPAFAHPPPCLRRRYPTSETFAVDGFQPLPPTGDSRKKKGGGEICACFRTPILLLAGSAPPRKPDPLTVISLSTRKSPGAAGALSLTPDGVSDPAEGATAQPAKRSRP